MNLYIVRHAIAVARGTPGFDDDSQRPLTDKGRKKMKKIAKGLRQFGVELDTILTSPYLRALDTAKILAGEYTMEDRILFSEHLIPPGNFEALVNEIHEKYEAANLALVGHEPLLSQFTGWLVSGNKEMNMNVKKGGVVCLSAENLYKDRRATLEWLLTPALLVALAK